MRPILMWRAKLGDENLLTSVRVLAGVVVVWLFLSAMAFVTEALLGNDFFRNNPRHSIGLWFQFLMLPTVALTVWIDVESHVFRLAAVKWYRSAPRNSRWWRLLPIRFVFGLVAILGMLVVSELNSPPRSLYLDAIAGIACGFAIAMSQGGLLFENPILRRMSNTRRSVADTEPRRRQITPRQRLAIAGFLALSLASMFSFLGAMLVGVGQQFPTATSLWSYVAGLVAGCVIAWILWSRIDPVVPAILKFFVEEFVKILLLALLAFTMFIAADPWIVFLGAVLSGTWVSTVPQRQS